MYQIRQVLAIPVDGGILVAQRVIQARLRNNDDEVAIFHYDNS